MFTVSFLFIKFLFKVSDIDHTYLHFTNGRTAHSVEFPSIPCTHLSIRVGAMSILQHRRPIQYGAVFSGSWTTTGMPNCPSLKVHFFSISKRISTLATSCASRMEMVVVPGLQNLTTNETKAVSALHAELLLVVFFAVWHSIPEMRRPLKWQLNIKGRIFQAGYLLSHVLAMENGATILAFEAPNMPLPFQSYQSLSILQFCTTPCAFIWPTWTSGGRPGISNGDVNAPLTKNFFACICHPFARRKHLSVIESISYHLLKLQQRWRLIQYMTFKQNSTLNQFKHIQESSFYFRLLNWVNNISFKFPLLHLKGLFHL